jgi:hypothetical protein
MTRAPILAAALVLSTSSAYADDTPKPPKEVEYSQGDPVPEGQVVATRTRYDLVLGGAVTFVAFYLAPSVASAVCKGDHPDKQCTSGWAFVPIAGPLVDMAVTDKMPGGSKATLIVASLGQVGGAAVMVTGLALEKKVLVPVGTPVAALPVVGPSYAGLAAMGAF